MNPGVRRPAGTRPVQQVHCAERPDDWLCCWSYRQPPDRAPYWELKFIHNGCRDHQKLAAV